MPTLAQFFQSSAAIPITGRPVTFRAIRREEETLAVEVRALLTFVDETARAEAHRDADQFTNSKLQPGAVSSETAREDERVFHVLFRSLRDVAEPHGPLCKSVDELRGALTLPVAQDLWAEYQRMLAEEFPAYVDAEEFKKLVDRARNFPLPALLADFDSQTVRRSLPSLGALLLPSGTPK